MLCQTSKICYTFFVMKLFYWICFSTLLFGLLFRINLGGAGILLSDILLPLFAFSWILKKFTLRQILPSNKFIFAGIIFIGIAFFSFLLNVWSFSFSEQLVSFSYIIRLISLLIFGWASTEFFKTEFEQKKFFSAFWRFIGILLFIGFSQFYLFPDISNFSTEGGFDPHIGRFLSTWMDPNFIGGLLAFTLPILIAQIYQNKKNYFLISLCIASLLALFLTFSRSAYLASICGLLFFFLFKDPKIILLGIGLAILGLASNERAQKRVGELMGTLSAVIFQQTDEIDPTASLRIQSWQKSFELWEKYPLLGIGYNTYRFKAAEEGIVDESYFSAGGSDSSFLTILVTTGIIGFGAFCFFIGNLFFRNFYKFWKHHNLLCLGFSAGLLGICVHSTFVNSLLFPLILMPIVSIAGLLENNK